MFSHICNADYFTGAERLLHFLAKELSNVFDCVLVVPNEGMLAESARNDGISVVVYDYPLLWSMYQADATTEMELNQLRDSASCGGLINLLHMHRPDWVLVNTVVNPYPAAAAKALGIPVVWNVTEAMEAGTHLAGVASFIEREADWVVGISHTTLKPLYEGNDSLRHKSVILYPSWSDSADEAHVQSRRSLLRTTRGIGEHELCVGYVSSVFYPNKGLEHFVRMAIEIAGQHPDVRFVIYGSPGEPGYYHQCVELIEGSGFSERFLMLPFEPDVCDLYAVMDILVVPSLVDEGFGMTALEGLVYGKPVVAYDAGGLREILDSTGQSQFIAAKGDIAGLAERVKALCIDPALRAAAAVHGSHAVRSVFGQGAYQGRLHAWLQQLMPTIHSAKQHTAGRMKSFPSGTLLKGERSTAVFLLENDVKRPFSSGEAFEFYRYSWEEVITLPDAELHAYSTGARVSEKPPFSTHAPSTFLAKGSGPTVYLIKNGIRHPFQSEEQFRWMNYRFERVVTLSDEVIGSLPEGEPFSARMTPVAVKRKAGKSKRKKAKIIRSKRGAHKKGLRLRRRHKPSKAKGGKRHRKTRTIKNRKRKMGRRAG
ncbi:glycosyltransferase family 4 protein [Paenibacillus turpanensis]|uniref:glycosyltransferase family 4 protein n=1 Tax=Paenibacillus turpanensis TaxID=2689078 RepID=UPI00140BDBDF|nr:glycosyltransferase family 4 protein [Paenibacillus turpanensis]